MRVIGWRDHHLLLENPELEVGPLAFEEESMPKLPGDQYESKSLERYQKNDVCIPKIRVELPHVSLSFYSSLEFEIDELFFIKFQSHLH